MLNKDFITPKSLNPEDSFSDYTKLEIECGLDIAMDQPEFVALLMKQISGEISPDVVNSYVETIIDDLRESERNHVEYSND